MIRIIFSIHDGRTKTGYKTIEHEDPSLELARDFMHRYHNRSTGWFHWEEDGKRYAAYDGIGVLR